MYTPLKPYISIYTDHGQDSGRGGHCGLRASFESVCSKSDCAGTYVVEMASPSGASPRALFPVSPGTPVHASQLTRRQRRERRRLTMTRDFLALLSLMKIMAQE